MTVVTDSETQIHPLVRRLALAVTAVSLLPITMGALVTTLKAGMAFADWPSSDGHQMLLYPWLDDFGKDPAKFTEHGHRLAGVLIGVLSLALAGLTLCVERMVWLRRYVIVIVLAVIGQGLLGGARVLLDRATLAMLHSVSGALFFCLCGVLLSWIGSTRRVYPPGVDFRFSPAGFAIIVFLPVVALTQYLLGAAVRHLHTMIDEHIAGAVVLTTVALCAVVLLWRAGSAVLRRRGWLMFGLLATQIGLGLAAYVARLGLPLRGIVAVEGSLSQAVFCTSHTVVGILLLNSTVVTSVVCVQLAVAGRLSLNWPDPIRTIPRSSPLQKGAL